MHYTEDSRNAPILLTGAPRTRVAVGVGVRVVVLGVVAVLAVVLLAPVVVVTPGTRLLPLRKVLLAFARRPPGAEVVRAIR